MTGNEIDKLSWDKFQRHPDIVEIELALAACKEERARIVREIKREAKAIDAGVSKPDLWALARYIEDTLL
jgi:hypothetical protein